MTISEPVVIDPAPAPRTRRPGTDPGRLLAALDGEARHALMNAVAREAVASELRRWRAAVSGREDEELALVWVLEAGKIGAPAPTQSVSDELDARLAALPNPGLVPAGSVEAALAAWNETPGDATGALRWAELQARNGPPPAAFWPEVLDPSQPEAASMEEAAQILVADARAVAEQPGAASAIAAAAARARLAEASFGRAELGALPERPTSGVLTDYEDLRLPVLGLLLMRVFVGEAPSERDFRGALGARLSGVGGRLRRVALGVAISVALVLALSLLPRSLTGNLPGSRLTSHDGSVCGTCAPNQQVDAAGWYTAQQRVFLTLRLAGEAKGASLGVILGSASLYLRNQEDGWNLSAVGDLPFPPQRATVDSKGRDVLVVLPEGAAAEGIAVTTAAGDRVPASGTLAPTSEPGENLNLIDVLIALILTGVAVVGVRRGFLRLVPTLAGFTLALVAARILFRPIGSLLLDSQVDLPRTAFSIAMAVVTAIVGIGCYLLAGGLTRLLLPRVRRWLPLRPDTTPDRVLGGVGRALLATAAVAEGSTLLVNLAAFSFLAGPVQASILGRALITIWRRVYPGL